ncbi:YpjP family protein [Solibacillus sp. MA9]|uniref:YpjP family protein n=1 Tax=Solibacillus palustris TaxID=2908203 RepID=A0ABS9UE34_9BACL|nr:YpjP family protein [Solibacillus sp. MA9]MCH7322592.1 YpjP family protein [Solibacillus sp. MA9]
MKKWLYKSLVASVAFLTLGLITPNHEIWANFDEDRGNNKPIIDRQTDNQISAAYQLDEIIVAQQQLPTVDTFIDAAKEQSYIKFGTRIGPVIEDEFETNIFPKIEEAIAMTVDRLGVESLSNLSISEKPSGEYSEKIFHIVNNDSKKDVIRFHVRTENRPFEGYYYNFHYHTIEDNYQTHYTLGDIYWSKNTPPKWLS